MKATSVVYGWSGRPRHSASARGRIPHLVSGSECGDKVEDLFKFDGCGDGGGARLQIEMRRLYEVSQVSVQPAPLSVGTTCVCVCVQCTHERGPHLPACMLRI